VIDAIAIASESLFLHLGDSSIALVLKLLFKSIPSIKLPSDHAVGIAWGGQSRSTIQILNVEMD